jgi:hypothetical protein
VRSPSAVAALLVALVGCGGRSAEPAPPEPAPAVAAVEPPAPVVAVAVDPLLVSWRDPDPARASAMGPSQPGFSFCCGDGRLKIEIACADMLKRCYERRGSRWRATYGRHCKRALGEDCYLQDCDARCQ